MKGKQMRKLIYAINLSMDGCFGHTDGIVPDEGLYDYYMQLLTSADTLVYGRKTYQLMVPYWPDIAKNQSESEAENAFARAFDSLNKVVFSKSLASAESNTKIFRGNLQDEVLKLKQQPGKHLLTGGVDIPSQLIALGLVDEFRFAVHPVMVGKGRRLFDDTPLREKVNLKLAEATPFPSGVVALRYTKQ
jgi:dihydrofolate reductase